MGAQMHLPADTSRRKRYWLCCQVGLLLLLLPQLEASHERPFVARRELEGISGLYLDVDGLPDPIGETEVSEQTIRDAVAAQLSKAGIKVLEPGDREAPTLRVRVLAPRVESQYAYTITVELEESCTIPRKPELQVSWCKTWSIYPRIRFLPVGRESNLKSVAVLAVGQFIDAWAADNGKAK